jgi:hypothetical protein
VGALTATVDGLNVATGAAASTAGVLTAGADGLTVAAGTAASTGGVLTAAPDSPSQLAPRHPAGADSRCRPATVAAGAAASTAGVLAGARWVAVVRFDDSLRVGNDR